MNDASNPQWQIVTVNEVTTLVSFKAIKGELTDGFPVARILMFCRQVDDLGALELIGLGHEAASMLSASAESWKSNGLAKVILPRSDDSDEPVAQQESVRIEQDRVPFLEQSSMVVYFDRPKDFQPPKEILLNGLHSAASVGVLKAILEPE